LGPFGKLGNRTQRSAPLEADGRCVLVEADANRIAPFRDFFQLHTEPAPDHPDTLLANLLKRGAGSRYRRLLGLPQGEWGVIAQLGARAPRTLGDLAAGMGLDITQISRSVSSLVERGFVTRSLNPLNNREVLIALSREDEAANAVIVDAGSPRQRTPAGRIVRP
jgi:DNA-binding MarR family transcriptional regulator